VREHIRKGMLYMIKLIVGKKGSGKTKILIDMVNAAAKTTDGNIVCVEKKPKLTYDLDHSVRLLEADSYGISGFDAFYGYIAGLLSGNYDITEVYVDSILKICGQDLEALGAFFDKIAPIAGNAGTKLIFTVSADESELPESVKKYL